MPSKNILTSLPFGGSRRGLWPIAVTLTIFVFAAVILFSSQQDLLYAAQDMSVWRSDNIFFEYYLHKPFGLLQYSALFLTQLFYYPWLGTLILILLWLASTLLTALAIAPRSLSTGKAILLYSPLGGWGTPCLLVGITQVGYWIYFLKLPSYWFLPTLLWLWWSVAMVIVLRLLPLCKSCLKRIILCVLACCWILLLTPWNGFSLFLFDVPDTFFYLTYIIMGVILLLQLIIGIAQQGRLSFLGGSILPLVGVVGAVLLLFTSGIMNYRNPSFHAELRMQQYAEHADWQSIINEMSDIKRKPTRQMVLMRDVALLHTNQLYSQSGSSEDTLSASTPPYEAGALCDGVRPEMVHGPKVHMAFTAAPILYFSCGYINDAYRWTVENSVEYGLSPRRLRMLLRCALVNHEWQLAMRYVRMLRLTIFHRRFADSMVPLVGHPERFCQHPELLEASHLKQHTDILTPTNNYPERILLSHPASPLYNHRTWHFQGQTAVHIY